MLASELFGNKMPDIEITGIAIDSRKVQNGYVFICISGLEDDGHRYAKKAAENGAAVIVAEKPLDVNVPLVLVENTKIEMANISAKFYGEPEKRLKLVGITGTNGKTTVSYLIKAMLEQTGKKVGIIGTNEILVGHEDVGIRSTTPTTPNALELRQIFSKMVDMGAEYVVMEVSSHALDLHRVYGLEYEVGVFTNLTRDHLDYHKTMENYFLAKKKLFDISKTGVINMDDDYGARLLKSVPCKTLSVGTKDADLRAVDIDIEAKGVEFTAEFDSEKYTAKLAISGMFSVYNALCALGAAIALGLDIKTALCGLANATGVKGRLERVPLDTDYSVIIDYAHTPDGLENVLNAVNSFKKGRCIAVFGCGGDRDATKRPIMGDIGTKLADIAVITSDNPRTEDPKKIIDDIVAGVKGGEYKVIVNRREAIKYALSIAKKDDIVLLAGKGQETYQIIGKVKNHFDEREIVRDILGE
ncbi:MAG: UDP-N-acetylmuramoyl-L-alanyl-D-glutamate--2,6-diaminopimelate ligase [Firmicutes bacterium]|nr:UDP-N-acetylmuramoyl-L-alanyl-D-glutamate--2,6-diaminopimelate ligase [Bacillota bacterium]